MEADVGKACAPQERTKVYFVTAGERTSFWDKNADAIRVGLIPAALGGILGIVGTIGVFLLSDR